MHAEVPETFQAIQTYRAAVVLLSQARTFVEEMTSGGMIDEKTARAMEHVVDRRMHEVCVCVRAGATLCRNTSYCSSKGRPLARGVCGCHK